MATHSASRKYLLFSYKNCHLTIVVNLQGHQFVSKHYGDGLASDDILKIKSYTNKQCPYSNIRFWTNNINKKSNYLSYVITIYV